MTKPTVALFGFGRMGRIHFKTLLENQYRLNLAYIVDERPDFVKNELKKYNLSKTEVVHNDETKKVLGDNSLYAIIICVPTDKHGDLVKQALLHKKHVMCEKPIALTIEETQQCYDSAKENGVTLFCALNRMFDPDYARIKKQIEDGTIGTIQMVSFYVRDHPEPAQATIAGLGNMFSDMGVHCTGTISWMVGELPKSVTAFAHAHNPAYAERDDFDALGMMLKFPCGAIGYSDSTRVTPYGYDSRLEILGTKASAVNETPSLHQVTTRDADGIHRAPMQYSFPQRFADSYKLELEHFLDVISGKAELQVTGDFVIAISKACIAAEESARTGQTIHLNP